MPRRAIDLTGRLAPALPQAEHRQVCKTWNDIPANKGYSADDAQCDDCGGFGCTTCTYFGWLSRAHPHARRCAYAECDHVIPPNQVAVYCCNDCALEDA
jgi:hypothetical protein